MTSRIDVRRARSSDHAQLAEILVPVFRAGDTYPIDPTISAEDAVTYWTGPSHVVWVAEVDGEVLGTYYIRPNQAGNGAHVCNCGYMTAPAARGRGVARAMLTHSLTYAREVGYRAMQYNFVVSTNRRAVETWTRAGFKTVGRVPDVFHHPREGYVDALVMWKDLTGSETE